MQISAILEEIRDLGSGNSNSTDLDNTTLLRRVNAAYEQVVAMIMGMDGKWQFDDSNYTDFPIGITTLVNSQQDYTFASDVLEIEGVSVLDQAGNWRKLVPINDKDLGVDPAEFAETDGAPTYYDKQGRSVLLYPAPDNGVSVTLANGLKVFFKRTADLYTSAQFSTGTKEPGFASPFHMIIPYKAVLSYLAVNIPTRVPFVLGEIKKLEEGLKDHYGRREQDRKKVMTMRGISAD